MHAPQPLPMSLQHFAHQQPTLPRERLVDPAETRQYPYGTYWWRAIAGIVLAGRVKPKHDKSPNMTDVNRLCKEANFNQYLFERVAKFLVNAQIIDVSQDRRAYVPGEYTEAFWQRDLPTLQQASRRAFLAFVQQLTGYQVWRPTIAVQSDLDMLVTLLAAAFAGLALPVERVGPILLAFSQLPEADMRQALEQLGRLPEVWHSLYWTPWLDARGQQVVLSALYMCEWAYVVEYQGQEWFYISDTARLMLGLEEVLAVPPLTTDFKVLPNFCVLAGIDLPLETLVPLFRYSKIQRIDRVVEFQLNRQHLADMPPKTSGQHELRAVLQDLGPLPATIERLLSDTRTVTGTMRIRGCSAIVKPENAEVLVAIKAHRRLKGYLDTEAPAGYLLLKPRSNPHEFIRRCQELGFTVTAL